MSAETPSVESPAIETPSVDITVDGETVAARPGELLIDACERTGEASFKGLWSRTLGAGSAWVVDACIALMCLSAAIIYSGILGDVSTSLLTLAGAPAALVRRPTNILAITACLLLPLSLLKDLSKLAFTSLLGCAAVPYERMMMQLDSATGEYADAGAQVRGRA